MNHRIVSLFQATLVATSITISVASPAGNDVAKAAGPKAILEEVQGKLNRAKTFSVTTLEERGGGKIETKCAVKQYGEGDVSCRQEQRMVLPRGASQPFVSIMNHNKLYFFPTGCGNVIVRVKYLETREVGSPVANLFFSDGSCEVVSDADSECAIRYTCTPEEIRTLKLAMEKKLGVEVKKDMTPAALEYKISKGSQTLLEATIYSERGKLITKQAFKDWKFDVEIPESAFEIPKGFKLFVVKSAKEAGLLQAELMRKAMAEQAKQQQRKKQQK